MKIQLLLDNYRLDNAIKELCSALKVYTTNYKTHTKFILIAGDNDDYIYASNGKKLTLTTPILIAQLELIIKKLKGNET